MSQQHEDKNRIFIPGDKPTPSPNPSLLLHREEKERLQAEELKAKKEEAFQAKKKILQEQWEAFLADQSVIEQIEGHGIEWSGPGCLVHLFVADFQTTAKIILDDDDVYKKFTPYAKIVSIGAFSDPIRKEWKVGDIVHLSDSLMNIQINPNFRAWEEGQKSNARLLGDPPPKYIRKIYGWIIDGKLYAPDKSRYCLNNEYAILTEDSLRKYPGPYVFELQEFETGYKRVKGNPWV